ncbi:MAG TPA: hypothetical protein VMT00_16205 [Thermoanaerobaculia bacterium]|nr:hypothetical protein [Thermoanaerobaculia bacterium]
MEGIRFLTDEKGHKVAVQIDLERYGEMWEDFYDQLVAEERKDDKRIPLSALRKRLVRAGKLRG